jgi:hypothetical protein
MSMHRRLDRLTVIYRRQEHKPSLSPDERERRYLSTPALYWALLDIAESRGRRRLLEPGQPAQAAWDAWHRLDEPERWERQTRELEILDALVRDLGRAMGLETWVREAVAIGTMFEGETGDSCWRMFQYSFASFRGSLDRARANHPTWGVENGWGPDMNDEEFLAFEWDLLDRLPELWARERQE